MGRTKTPKHKEISVAEFFEKNKHILGYSNPSRSLITVIKEAVDNALDACEEAKILPDIFIKITRVNNNYKIVVEDNGPGIPKDQIPKVFGKLLYGSRFHEVRQSRGQQGIGISAAVLYAQLTTGKPAKIISKLKEDPKAYKFILYINTRKNEPEIVEEGEEDWYLPHGTRIELEIVGSYSKERRQSVLEYLRETSIVNPQAKITFVDPDGEVFSFQRVSEELPDPPISVKPHPHGIELGALVNMLNATKERTLKKFLKNEFERIGERIAEAILQNAGIDESRDPRSLSRQEIERLHKAFKLTNLLPPSTNCLSPIGEKFIMKSLLSKYSPEFVCAVTRKPKAYSGHPFLVEVGLAYGGEIRNSDKINVLRYANKIPLLYQQSGCSLTKSIIGVNWRNYGLTQNKGELPSGPVVLLIHLASTNIPYTSESKEAVAPIPEILEELKLALQEAGRKLREYLDKKEKKRVQKRKEREIARILPLIAEKTCKILKKEVIDVNRIVAHIMGYLYLKREISEENDWKIVKITLSNYTRTKRVVKITEILQGDFIAPEAKCIDSVYKSLIWDVTLNPNEEVEIKYKIRGSILNKKPIVEGIDPDFVVES